MAGFGWLLALTLPVAGAPTELTRDAEWQYRGTNAAPLAAEWPKVWTTFTPWDYETGASSSNDNPCAFACAPTNLTLNGISACRATLPLYPRDVLDLTVGDRKSVV